MSLPAAVGRLATDFYRDQATRTKIAATQAQNVFRTLGPNDPVWDIWDRQMADQLVDITLGSQARAAGAARSYVDAQARVQGYAVNDRVLPSAFTSPPDELRYWLGYVPATLQRSRLSGLAFTYAKRVALDALTRQVGTLTADAGREASGVTLAVTPGLNGFYRKLVTPSCDRCAVLAGAYYSFAEPFRRHPRCDCVHVPVSEADESLAFDAEEALRQGKIGSYRRMPDGSRKFESALSEAERDAILNEGADMNRIVNSKRWRMRTTAMHGYRRTSPTSIYRAAGGNRDRIRALLRQHGYIL